MARAGATRWEANGFQPVEEKDADFTVTVNFDIPGVFKYSHDYPFKRFWSEVREYADGSSESTSHSGVMTMFSRFKGKVYVTVDDMGPIVDLDLTWDGKRSGHIKRKLLVPWSDPEQIISDDDVQMDAIIHYHTKGQPVSSPSSAPHESGAR